MPLARTRSCTSRLGPSSPMTSGSRSSERSRPSGDRARRPNPRESGMSAAINGAPADAVATGAVHGVAAGAWSTEARTVPSSQSRQYHSPWRRGRAGEKRAEYVVVGGLRRRPFLRCCSVGRAMPLRLRPGGSSNLRSPTPGAAHPLVALVGARQPASPSARWGLSPLGQVCDACHEWQCLAGRRDDVRSARCPTHRGLRLPASSTVRDFRVGGSFAL